MVGRTFVVRGAGAGLAAVAACVALVGCEADLGGTDDAGSAPSGTVAEAVEPGEFSVLPEPCVAVDPETLNRLLPGADEEAHEGEPMATFDTGRRVGCEWHGPTASVTHRLAVDLERVISYDPEVSDDDQARLDFEQLAAESGVTLDGSTTEPGVETDTGAGTTFMGEDVDADGEGGDGADSGGEGSQDTAPPSVSDPISHPLDDIGHVAFLDDQLTSLNTGASREVVVAFRSANVIVTVTYTVSTTVAGEFPDSTQLQEGAQDVARQLASGFES
ncbi:DUF3558 domain-containing protein [Streptomyces sp. 4N509B]|uniref:DUF3558 domain-containing protein n=1 Tax=Streptomyces sp. 4N509B TaxID=3457413 RepID=UPI003FD3DF94